MKKIVFFDTSYGSQNMGDRIINDAIDVEMDYLKRGNFVVKYGTHLPLARFLQNIRKNATTRYCESADLKFICGTNILRRKINIIPTVFNINLNESRNYKNSILLGCGVSGAFDKSTLRTRFIYKKILSKEYIHSVRDEKAKEYVESLGLKALNTGCPTLWGLTADVCNKIPTKKSEKVVFTLTDYNKDPENDQKLIDVLLEKYKEIYFWVQGSNDYEYLKTMKGVDDVKILYSLEEYRDLLSQGGIDYVGTRLHAGICAMQNKVRSIILVIDNRARDMKKSYNLPTLERDEVIKLGEMIDSEFETDVKIDTEKIEAWKAQFRDRK